jgi:UDP-N-acetylglucosamine 2-epimerase (non-hydrolysing)
MRKIIIVFGTRPEAIKLAPVIAELKKRGIFKVVVVVTAQHREMLDQVLSLFNIVPDYDLDIMQPEQSLFDISVQALEGLEKVLIQEKPDLLLVQGDTTTTFVAALAAFYLKIPVGHVEAGLRTFDKQRPFPEEINRKLTTALADLHFAPTEQAKLNLLAEGVPKETIYVTGNTVIDALLATVRDGYKFNHPILSQIDFSSYKTLLVTAHRRESWGKPLSAICEAIKEIVTTQPDVCVVFSIHLNPEVQRTVNTLLDGEDRVFLVDPIDYEPFVQLMDKAHLILTDSGGIQEEAPSLGKPVLVLRELTERPEAVEAGTVKVVGREPERIVSETIKLIRNQAAYKQMAQAINPYGDGRASERIANIITDYFKVANSQSITTNNREF